MSKRTVFTTLTPLPPGVSREVVMETLKSHTEMIDLNPLVIERHPVKPPSNATSEEYHCIWYQLTDRVQYLPGGLASGQVTYTCCFHDLKDGLQTHCYAPMGLDIKGKWTLGGSLPGEPIAPVELGLGAPLHGLWLREDVDMRCNIMMGGFVKKTLKKAHSALVGRLLVKSQIQEAARKNAALNDRISTGPHTGSQTSTEYSPSDYDAQSMVEGSISGGSPRPSQSPPMFAVQNTSSHRSDPSQNFPNYRSEQSDPRTSFDSRLHPAALNIRNSDASQKGSYPYPHPYQDPAAGGQHPSERVSWQNLHQRQSPSMGSQEVPVYLAPNTYRPPVPPKQSYTPPAQQQQRYTKLPSQQRQDGRQKSRMDSQIRSQSQDQAQGQAQAQVHRYQSNNVAELE
ncbi:uncharacterized protein RCO7_03130 [Rhynchosporium graminicola]|uniref:DUF7053 domain-containing protein n=1 Tax=Rhynchosporium graminicola TaxID=2792576 RepID=A0A1E1KS36_9HELO|nr:uncharacterized protein RCO7_03130 [Rhynchosporium commune]